MQKNSEWDGDGEIESSKDTISLSASDGMYTLNIADYATASGSFTTTVGSAWTTINLENHVKFVPTKYESYSLKLNFSEASWKQVINIALHMFLGPILCIVSKIRKKVISLC